MAGTKTRSAGNRDKNVPGKQPPLRLGDAAYERLPADLKPLVAWWKEERTVVALDQSVLR